MKHEPIVITAGTMQPPAPPPYPRPSVAKRQRWAEERYTTINLAEVEKEIEVMVKIIPLYSLGYFHPPLQWARKAREAKRELAAQLYA